MTAATDAHGRLTELIRADGDRLLAFAYQLTHERAAAQDVVQEAFARLLETSGRRTLAPDNWSAYTRQCVLNEFLRRNRRSAAGEVVRADFSDHPDRALVAGDLAADVVERDRIWRELAQLPARQRAALVLRYYEDLPDRAIAGALRCREATVRSLVARGLSSLRAGSLAGDAEPEATDR